MSADQSEASLQLTLIRIVAHVHYNICETVSCVRFTLNMSIISLCIPQLPSNSVITILRCLDALFDFFVVVVVVSV